RTRWQSLLRSASKARCSDQDRGEKVRPAEPRSPRQRRRLAARPSRPRLARARNNRKAAEHWSHFSSRSNQQEGGKAGRFFGGWVTRERRSEQPLSSRAPPSARFQGNISCSVCRTRNAPFSHPSRLPAFLLIPARSARGGHRDA